MKTTLLGALVVALAIAGCGGSKRSQTLPATTSSTASTTTPTTTSVPTTSTATSSTPTTGTTSSTPTTTTQSTATTTTPSGGVAANPGGGPTPTTGGSGPSAKAVAAAKKALPGCQRNDPGITLKQLEQEADSPEGIQC